MQLCLSPSTRFHPASAHVERLVRVWRYCDRQEEADLERARHEAARSRSFRTRTGGTDEQDGASDGADAADVEPPRPDHRQRMADAIGLLAEQALASDERIRRAGRFQVVLHVDESRVRAGAVGREEGGEAAAADGCRADGQDGGGPVEGGSRSGSGSGPRSQASPDGQSVLADSGRRVTAETRSCSWDLTGSIGAS